MKLSAPLYRLKRQARLLARAKGLPLHAALDQMAAREGFASWSLLAAKGAPALRARDLLARLRPGDLVLVGARPGHGKTLLSIELMMEAMKAGRRGAYFTLEGTRADVTNAFRALGAQESDFTTRFAFDNSDAISADHIMAQMTSAPPGTLIVVDYLQLLDQKRDKPELMVQIRALKSFAREKGLTLLFISQIDRSFDPLKKPCPDLDDVRLPNPLDLALFDKACFLHQGEVRFRESRPPL
ncbi:MAG: DNA helicase [Parvibaculaceae bacterium]